MFPIRIFCVFLIVLNGYSLSAQDSSLEQANSLIKKGSIKEARELLLASYNKRKDPKITERLGDVYGIEKNWDEASKYYKELVNQFPENANYHFKYGGVLGMIALESKIRALSVLGDVKKHFKKAAQLDPENLEVRWASIDLYLKLPGILGGSTDKAYQYSKELSSISPLEGFLSKAFIEKEEGNSDLAEVYNKRALDMVAEKGFPTRTYKRKDIHYQIGEVSANYNYKKQVGIHHLLTFESLYSPESVIPLSDVYMQLAKLYRLQNDKEKASFYLQKAKEVNPSDEKFEKEAALINKL
ncbi:tetratricopeptide repeat protein [Galbibacter sp. BG1]|uniref:tetratricopeptide repeat protein n=1 Tax=Galbibacter sp. BG1 TaxID=1170699 RepID=UPI0015C003AC|nr:tetratricopeptide repeat protein [Galbibacter sp. BG1]QLE00576.1 tetratricopeptide repeat protein [Galbibacter sp. BG1]